MGCRLRAVAGQLALEDAQVNALSRMVARYGRLLAPEEFRTAAKHDAAAFGPGVQLRYRRELEPPDPAEGFSSPRPKASPFQHENEDCGKFI